MKLSHKGPHKYLKALNGTDTIFRCTLPTCSHYIRAMFIVNKASICWRCDGEFIITAVESRQKKPHCRDCTRLSYNPKIRAQQQETINRVNVVSDLLDDLGIK